MKHEKNKKQDNSTCRFELNHYISMMVEYLHVHIFPYISYEMKLGL